MCVCVCEERKKKVKVTHSVTAEYGEGKLSGVCRDGDHHYYYYYTLLLFERTRM